MGHFVTRELPSSLEDQTKPYKDYSKMDEHGALPSDDVKITIEHCHRNSCLVAIEHGVFFSSYENVYQRV